MTTATLSFRDAGQVRLECPELSIDEKRQLEDGLPFTAWAREYAGAQYLPSEEIRLLDLGRAIGAWLDGSQGWLRRLVESATPPLILQIESSMQPSAAEQEALSAPWELIAQIGTNHLAIDNHVKIQLCTVRRIDVPGKVRPRSQCRLSVLFMAAQPLDTKTLDFEHEEAEIATKVGKLGLDLFVEESGTLDGLLLAANRAADCKTSDDTNLAGPVDVMHVSCHGRDAHAPSLLLEDESGNSDAVTPDRFDRVLATQLPALAFVSAYSTGDVTSANPSFAAELCMRRWPAVLGWSGLHSDGVHVNWFAGRLYQLLAQRISLLDAFAQCRYDAVVPGMPPRRVWHQVRLFLGRAGGDRIVGGAAVRQPARASERQFLDSNGASRVALDTDFVGRRRALQRVLASLRDEALIGAVVHGAGGVGKSSLAARVRRRRPDLQTVVIAKDFDAEAILGSISTSVRRNTEQIIETHRHRTEGNSAWDTKSFGSALRELLEGPCSKRNDGAILLILDDFDRMLILPHAPDTLAKVHTNLASTITALIGAFDGAQTDSQLLVTSRYRFTVPDNDDRDLANLLWNEPLGAMPQNDLAKLVHANAVNLQMELQGGEYAARRASAATLCRGNPGLLTLLLAIINDAPSRWPLVEAGLRAYGGHSPAIADGEIAAFMDRVGIASLIGEVDPQERELLRLLTSFETHVPMSVAAIIGTDMEIKRGANAIERLVTSGLIDLVLPISSRPELQTPSRGKESEVCANPLAVRHVMDGARPPVENATAKIAETVIRPLRKAWDGAVCARALRECQELSRLATLANDTLTLAEVVGPIIVGIQRADPDTATLLVMKVEACETLWPNSDELRRMAQLCQNAGEVAAAGRLLSRALNVKDTSPAARARLQYALASWHLQRRELDAAESLILAARDTFECLGDVRNTAIAMGQMADVLLMRGNPDAALRVHREAVLPVLDRLGDVRARALTMGQIAEILHARGELNEALRIRREEQLPVFEQLGDAQAAKVTRSKIAELLERSGGVKDLAHPGCTAGSSPNKDAGENATQTTLATLAKAAEILQKQDDPNTYSRLSSDPVPGGSNGGRRNSL